jgi:glycosyltransferase involved in cell wall biosynthesis
MRVLMVSEPGMDGVFRYVEALCHFLVGEEVEVHLAYSDRRGSDRLADLVAFIAAHGGATLNLRTSNVPAPRDLPAFLALARLARAIRPDVIHSHSSKAGALARLLPLLGIGAVQVYSPHAYVGMRPEPGRFDFAYDLIEAALGRTGRTLICSGGEHAFARSRLGIPAARLQQVRHGVDLALFRPADAGEKRRLRAGFGLPETGLVLGFMGRSSAQKDPLTLYRAFARLAAAEPDVSLLHVGRGELDPELERMAAEPGLRGRVFRIPYLSTPADFYRAVDGFVLTSHYEGFSLAALEALAADLPMILSEAPGNSDLLAEPLSHAWRAAPGDVEGFARALAAWAASRREGQPPNHRELARSRFESVKQHQAILQLYRDWAGAPSPRLRTCFPEP